MPRRGLREAVEAARAVMKDQPRWRRREIVKHVQLISECNRDDTAFVKKLFLEGREHGAFLEAAEAARAVTNPLALMEEACSES